MVRRVKSGIAAWQWRIADCQVDSGRRGIVSGKLPKEYQLTAQVLWSVWRPLSKHTVSSSSAIRWRLREFSWTLQPGRTEPINGQHTRLPATAPVGRQADVFRKCQGATTSSWRSALDGPQSGRL